MKPIQPPKFEARVRFNWGFHDAAYDVERKLHRDMSGHFDHAYAAGYEAGKNYAHEGLDTSSSEQAWQERKAFAHSINLS